MLLSALLAVMALTSKPAVTASLAPIDLPVK
jgi:hypothetical protein